MLTVSCFFVKFEQEIIRISYQLMPVGLITLNFNGKCVWKNYLPGKLSFDNQEFFGVSRYDASGSFLTSIFIFSMLICFVSENHINLYFHLFHQRMPNYHPFHQKMSKKKKQNELSVITYLQVNLKLLLKKKKTTHAKFYLFSLIFE